MPTRRTPGAWFRDVGVARPRFTRSTGKMRCVPQASRDRLRGRRPGNFCDAGTPRGRQHQRIQKRRPASARTSRRVPPRQCVPAARSSAPTRDRPLYRLARKCPTASIGDQRMPSVSPAASWSFRYAGSGRDGTPLCASPQARARHGSSAGTPRRRHRFFLGGVRKLRRRDRMRSIRAVNSQVPDRRRRRTSQQWQRQWSERFSPPHALGAAVRERRLEPASVVASRLIPPPAPHGNARSSTDPLRLRFQRGAIDDQPAGNVGDHLGLDQAVGAPRGAGRHSPRSAGSARPGAPVHGAAELHHIGVDAALRIMRGRCWVFGGDRTRRPGARIVGTRVSSGRPR